jgi:hypothetical protein
VNAAVGASAGAVLEPASFVVGSLLEALDIVHFDQLTTIQMNRSVELNPHAAALVESAKGKVDGDKAAALNKMLVADCAISDDLHVRPGNVYIVREEYSQSMVGVEWDRLVLDVCEGNEKDDKAKKKFDANREALLKETFPVFVEITPSCDFAQAKQRIGRFIAGLLVPTDHSSSVKKGEYIWRSPSLNLPRLKEWGFSSAWRLVLNAHFLYGIPTDVIGAPADFRLRAPPLLDIRAWVAGHGARPGFVSVG